METIETRSETHPFLVDHIPNKIAATKLLNHVGELMRVRLYSIRTEQGNVRCTCFTSLSKTQA